MTNTLEREEKQADKRKIGGIEPATLLLDQLYISISVANLVPIQVQLNIAALWYSAISHRYGTAQYRSLMVQLNIAALPYAVVTGELTTMEVNIFLS